MFENRYLIASWVCMAFGFGASSGTLACTAFWAAVAFAICNLDLLLQRAAVKK